MLQSLRDKSSGWIATVILGLLCIPFAFFGMEQYLFQRNATFVAKIEAPPKWWPTAPSFWPVTMLWTREEIGADEFRTAFDQQRRQQQQTMGDAFDPREFESVQSKREILESLVDRRVMRMLAERDGIAIGDAQVRQTIESIPAFQVAGRFDPQSYQLALSSQNQTPLQFEDVMRSDLQQTVIPRAIAESAFVTRSEIDRLLRLLGETRDVTFVVLPPPAADAAPVADAEVQRWYQQHAAQFRAPESVTLEVLDVDSAQLAAPAIPDEQQLRARYEQEKGKFGGGERRQVSHILVKAGTDAASQKAAEQKANEIAAKAKAPGADFAALARVNSDDAGSKNSGGDLSWIERNGAMVKPFEDAVFAMQSGEIRGPVKTDFGYHVIQLRQIQAGTQKPFEDVREQLLAEATETDREKTFNDLLGKVVDEVYKNPTTLAAAAALAKRPVQTLGPVTRMPTGASAADPILGNPAVLRAAFSDNLIQDGTVSDPVEITPSRSVLLRVKAHAPERALPLAEVRPRVVEAIRAERSAKAAETAADALLAEAKAGQGLSTVAQAQGLQVVDLTGVERGQPVPDAAANEAMFATPVPAAGKPSLGKAPSVEGMVVFAVNKVVPADAAKAQPAQRVALQEQLGQVAGVEDAQALVRTLRKRMKITVAEDRL